MYHNWFRMVFCRKLTFQHPKKGTLLLHTPLMSHQDRICCTFLVQSKNKVGLMGNFFTVLLYESRFNSGWLWVGNEGSECLWLCIPFIVYSCRKNMMQSFLLIESWPLFPCHDCKAAYIGLYNRLEELWIFACTGVWFKPFLFTL